MTHTHTRTRTDLSTLVHAPHERALRALEAGPAGAAEAVAWLSAHLAAVGCVVHQAVGQAIPAGHQRVLELRACDHLLQQALCRLDRRLTGDVHLVHLPLQAYVDDVRDHLADHIALEDPAVAELCTRLASDDQQTLAGSLEEAMADAPTRPHPHTPHTPIAALVAKVDAAVDRLRDLMDNRTTSTPHRIASPRAPGRWGSYLMGIPYPADGQRRC